VKHHTAHAHHPVPRAIAGACGAALLLSACTVGPKFIPPSPPAMAKWNDPSTLPAATQATIDPQSNPDPRWWNGFNDPTLTKLVQLAIGGNLDLQQAVLRVVESRQSVAAARAAGLPSLNGQAEYTRENVGLGGILKSQGVYGDLNSLSSPNSTLNQDYPGEGTSLANGTREALKQLSSPINFFQYGLDASWELDLFGRVRRSVEQARAQTVAQIEATKDALVMLESEVAQAYMQLRGAQALTASQLVNVKTAQDTLQITQIRQTHGLVTDVDVQQALAQLADFQRQLPGYEAQTQQAMNRLSMLVGQTPGTLDAMLAKPEPIPAVPSVVSIGLPSTLARRRPDIREAEAQLHAATANVGIAVASFYPDLSLTGSLGIRAIDASYLTNWASHFYTLGPSLSLPVFQGGKLTASLRMARAQQAAAALAYRGTVLNALREVEDALVSYRTDRKARERIVQTIDASQISLNLAQARYAAGVADFLQVLDSERTLVTARQQLVQTDMTLTNDVVALYRALGGGWEMDQAKAAPVPGVPPLTPAALDSFSPALLP
jgi:NodT family efflux transporter outer membrane factor (OMF) lipoprotein